MFALASPENPRSLLIHAIRPYRKVVALGLATLITVDLLEIIPPLILKETTDRVVSATSQTSASSIAAALHAVLFFALAYVGVASLQSLCRYGWRIFLIRASHWAGRDLRYQFTEHLFGLSASFYDRRKIGDLMSYSISDMESIRMALGAGLLVMADALFYFTTVPVAMYLLSPRLTLLAFIPLPVIPLLVIWKERRIHERYLRVQDELGEFSARVQEGFTGIRVIKGFARESVQDERLRVVAENLRHLTLRLARVSSTFGPTLDVITSFGIVLLLWVGGRELIETSAAGGTGPLVQGALTLGTFVAFQRYIQFMVWPMTAVGLGITHYQRAITSSGRLKEIFAETSEVADLHVPVADRLPEVRPEVRPITWRTPGRIEAQNLSFRFPGGPWVLQDFSLTIEPGERVGIVGRIGSGKSAFLSLLPRLYAVERPGMLTIDQRDIRDWPLHELRRQVGYVSQEVFLFSQTVRENVALGLEDAHGPLGPEAADRLLYAAAETAAIRREIEALTQGWNTRLGERGISLSGGQKQRVTLARALVKNPAILVMDDALAAVDTKTERAILAALAERRGQSRRTEIIAAHRVTAISSADRIIVMDQGRIAESGTHAELIRRPSGIYARFYDQQRRREDLEAYEATLRIPTDDKGGGDHV